LAVAGAAHAATFTNGSFEDPGDGPVRRALVDGDTYVTGWTVSGAGTYYESSGQDGDGCCAFVNASDGGYYVAFGHDSTAGATLSQIFATLSGATYTVSYDFRLQQGADTDSGFLVSASTGDQVLSGDASNMAWASGAALTFTGTGHDVTLTFKDNTAAGHGGGSNLALDNVQIAVTGPAGSAAPEPAGWALTIVGFGGAGGALRRRRRPATAA
jgi:hypothetical protein